MKQQEKFCLASRFLFHESLKFFEELKMLAQKSNEEIMDLKQLKETIIQNILKSLKISHIENNVKGRIKTGKNQRQVLSADKYISNNLFSKKVHINCEYKIYKKVNFTTTPFCTE